MRVWLFLWTTLTLVLDASWLLGYFPVGSGLPTLLFDLLFLLPFNLPILLAVCRIVMSRTGAFPWRWGAALVFSCIVLFAGGGVAAVLIGSAYYNGTSGAVEPPLGLMLGVWAALSLAVVVLFVAFVGRFVGPDLQESDE